MTELDVNRMKDMAEYLIKYSYPQNAMEMDRDINILKTGEFMIDGYDITIYFHKAFYGDHYLETLQLFNNEGPFLPFNLVIKIVQMFLGTKHLYLLELLKDGKKIYLWNRSTDINREPIVFTLDKPAEKQEFEGFEYHYMSPTEVSFH